MYIYTENKRKVLTIVKLKVVSKYVFSKPDFGIGIEQTFVIVIRHSSTILDFTNHVPHSTPRHTL